MSSFEKCFFNWITPLTAAPHEFPAKIPSSRAIFLVNTAASLSVTFVKPSITEKSTFSGKISSPIPSVIYG
jgi:hypothetical protein